MAEARGGGAGVTPTIKLPGAYRYVRTCVEARARAGDPRTVIDETLTGAEIIEINGASREVQRRVALALKMQLEEPVVVSKLYVRTATADLPPYIAFDFEAVRSQPWWRDCDVVEITADDTISPAWKDPKALPGQYG